LSIFDKKQHNNRLRFTAALYMFKQLTVGADSSEGVRKMLALRDGARPSDTKRQHRPNSTQFYTNTSPPQTPSLISHSPSSVKSCPVNNDYGIV